MMPVNIGRKSTLELVNNAYRSKSPVILTTQMDSSVETPEYNDLYPIGVVGKIMKVLDLPNGAKTAIIIAEPYKIYLKELTSTSPYLMGKIHKTYAEDTDMEDKESKLIMNTCTDLLSDLEGSSDEIGKEFIIAMNEFENPAMKINFVCANLPIPVKEKYDLLIAGSIKQRCFKLADILSELNELNDLKMRVQMRAKAGIDKQQRDYFLQQQLKSIQDELGNGMEDEIDELRNKGKKKKWSKEVADIFEKEVCKLERINPQAPDYNTHPTALCDMACEYITQKKPVLSAFCFDNPDHVGHGDGHDTPAYYAKLRELDGYVGRIVDAIKEAGIYENSIIIVTADHGGINKGHGGKTMEEMETPFIIAGKNIKKGGAFEESMMQFDCASTIASVFNLEQPQVWIGRPMTQVFE